MLGDSDGKAPPPSGGGGGGGGDAGGDADAGALTVLASANHPKGIFLTGGYVYFTNYGTGAADGTVSRVGTDGSNAGDVATSLTAPWAIGVSGGLVFFTTAPAAGTGGVFEVAESGGTVTPIQQGLSGALGLGLDATKVFWTIDSGSGVSVGTVPIGGGAVDNVLDFGGALSPTAMVVSGNDVFVATSGTQAAVLHGLTNGAGNMAPLDTQAPETYGDLALSSTTVYATLDDDAPAGAIVGFPRAGGAAANVVTGIGHPGRLALDGTKLYYTDPAGGAVWVVDVSAPAAPVQVASGLASPLPIAVADAIYVGAADGIVRIPK